jgi:hypothetical protein
MKLYWYALRTMVQTNVRRRKPIPNAQPLMLWTAETGTWREIVVNPNRHHG